MADVEWLFGLNNKETAILLGAYKGLTAWASLISKNVKEGQDLPVKTGHLARNVRAGTVQVESKDRMWVLIGTGKEVPYTRAHELGSGLFASTGRRRKIRIWAGQLNPFGTKSLNPKKALSFRWPGGDTSHPAYNPETGKFSFAYVDHPGVPARHFLEKGVAKSFDRGRALVMSNIKAEMQRSR